MNNALQQEITEAEEFNERFRQYRRKYNKAFGVSLGFVGLLFAFSAKQCSDDMRNLEVDKERIIESLASDGFSGSRVIETYKTSDTAVVALNLGACSLDRVSARLVRNDAGMTIDVDSYSMLGFASVESNSHESTDGVSISFTFEGLEDLKYNILGQYPCKTLAASLTSG